MKSGVRLRMCSREKAGTMTLRWEVIRRRSARLSLGETRRFRVGPYLLLVHVAWTSHRSDGRHGKSQPSEPIDPREDARAHLRSSVGPDRGCPRA
jgi:hypothetical protein